MEFPEPWHQYAFEDWPRLEQAIRRLNSSRRRKGLSLLDPRPPIRSPRLVGDAGEFKTEQRSISGTRNVIDPAKL